MGGRFNRDKRRKYARELNSRYALPKINYCLNCSREFKKGETGHFVPPSMGQKGFFACEYLNAPQET